MLKTGDNVLVAHRRLFPEDQPRFFTGTVNEQENGVVMATGHSWVRDSFSGEYMRSQSERTKVFSLVSGALIVYQLPIGCRVGEVEFAQMPDQSLVLRDGQGFEMDLSERHTHPAPPSERRAS